jgi:hypothetical protein
VRSAANPLLDTTARPHIVNLLPSTHISHEVPVSVTRHVAIVCCTTLVAVGCAKSDQAAKDSAAAATAATPAPAAALAPTLSLADFAGKWQVRAVPETGKDTTPTNYVLTATADTTGWMIDFPSGVKVPTHVTVSGDSLLISTGVFSSQRRKSMKVMTEGSARLQNGKLVGTTVAHYTNAGPDSVLRLHIEGTKMP